MSYYYDESMVPSSLGGTLSLRNCGLRDVDDSQGDRIKITRPDGTNYVLIAPSVEKALEWRNALQESIALLRSSNSPIVSDNGKYRRENFANVDREESLSGDMKEKQQAFTINHFTHYYFLTP